MRRLFILLSCYLFVSGCHDATVAKQLPTVFLAHHDVTFTSTTHTWSQQPNTHTMKELLPIAQALTPSIVTAQSYDAIHFDDKQLTLEQLSVSFWKDGKETFVLFNVEDPSFYYPKELGDYMMVVFVETDFGTTQYVTSLTVTAET